MLKQCIDATKFETRIVKTGEGVDLPPDVGLIEGWPIDPPDERPGWLLVDVFVVTGDKPEYHVLWARPRGKAKKPSKKKKPETAAVPSKKKPETAPAVVKAPRVRKPRSKKNEVSEEPASPAEQPPDPVSN